MCGWCRELNLVLRLQHAPYHDGRTGLVLKSGVAEGGQQLSVLQSLGRGSKQAKQQHAYVERGGTGYDVVALTDRLRFYDEILQLTR